MDGVPPRRLAAWSRPRRLFRRSIAPHLAGSVRVPEGDLLMRIQGELWKVIPGWEDYEVSNLGRIRSLDRVDSLGRHLRGKLRPPCVNTGGYLQVGLSRNGRRTKQLIHRLVMLAFIGPPPPGQDVCHGDGTRTNNHLDNLRYDTRSANNRDAVLHGTHRNSAKTKCPQGHPYDSENTYWAPSRKRHCRTCHRARLRARRMRIQESRT